MGEEKTLGYGHIQTKNEQGFPIHSWREKGLFLINEFCVAHDRAYAIVVFCVSCFKVVGK